MAYEVINVKPNKGTFNGFEYDNVSILCYTDAESKNIICGENTDTLKMKRDDFNFVLRSKNYDVKKVAGAALSPVFDRNGNVVDFTLSNPETGEAL